ncbi:HupU protein [uncultured Thiothrix sp.]|uniref:NADH-quinone oxidoreductase subunit B family protein n=1 Tax=uncultured Thiothrix sp. TaxID=223185 RepID=UPI0026327234|nr:HupU protein [uncultured Thiothrix sp.]HMT93979.1 HupU protein [Thiolinea sp.]
MNILWLQSGSCGGCSMSLLNAEVPSLYELFKLADLNLLWHPSLSEASHQEFLDLLQAVLTDEIPLDILCLEGSVICGPKGSGAFHQLAGTQQSMLHWLKLLTAKAQYVVAVGSCAAFGGITAAGENIAEATGLQYDGALLGSVLDANWRSKAGFPVINIAGCPTHPAWVTNTLVQISMNALRLEDLDEFHRPRSYTNHLVHHGCPRNEFYEYKASAGKPADLGCMMEHCGCLGTQARADCNTHLWNGSGSCLRGGYPCINCTAPAFEQIKHAFGVTPKIAGIPIGLPSDMPKAWFVALASLSKAATPERVRTNAVVEQISIPPSSKNRGRK